MSVFPSFRRKKKRSASEIEPHETFLDNLAQKKEEEFGMSKKRLEVCLPVTTLRVFSFFVFLLFFILIARSFQMQFTEGDYFSVLAQRNILSISSTQTTRGVVYDRNYNQLVYNMPQYDLYFRKESNQSTEKESIRTVASIIERDFNELKDELTSTDARLITIKRDLSHEELVQLQSRIERIDGFSIASSIGREYKDGEISSHILGYIGKIDQNTLRKNPGKYTIHDYVGKAGVERYYENYLTRVGDEVKIERDAAGNIKNKEVTKSTENGENIVLTIDSELQRIVQEKAREKLEEIGAKKAAVVILDPQTGEVLAMVSVPSFDNNLFRKSTDQKTFANIFQNKEGVFLNRTISSAYSPGSIIKPILAAAALEEGIITPEKRIHSPGYITIPNPWNPAEPTIFRDFQAHGWRDMREAIAVSSNVYFYAVGGGYEDQEGLGVERIKKYLSLFGWGVKTGIDLPVESNGFIPTPDWKREQLSDIWRIGDTYNLSIGQGYLSTTPLQVAGSFASIVNGGKLLAPRIVKEIVDDERNLLESREAEVVRENFVSADNLEIVKQGMKQTTLIGTARSLQVLPVDSGAKTGTAQTSRPGINNNWVAAFAPYDNPEIVITVIIEGVKGVTPVATHLARDIMMEYFSEDKEQIKNSNE